MAHYSPAALAVSLNKQTTLQYTALSIWQVMPSHLAPKITRKYTDTVTR